MRYVLIRDELIIMNKYYNNNIRKRVNAERLPHHGNTAGLQILIGHF